MSVEEAANAALKIEANVAGASESAETATELRELLRFGGRG